MPRYYCDYCDTYLTHDSAGGRMQHIRGWKHRENVKLYYEQFVTVGGGYRPDMMPGAWLRPPPAMGMAPPGMQGGFRPPPMQGNGGYHGPPPPMHGGGYRGPPPPMAGGFRGPPPMRPPAQRSHYGP